MIKSASDMLIALKRGQYAGVILYQGPSLIDDAPIVVIANRITTASGNAKTGDMVQTFIIRADMSPMEALATGADASVCGSCIHRPRADGKRSCYVNVGRSVMSVYNAFKRGRYARPSADYSVAILPDLFKGLVFRIGAYGDGAAAPFPVWRAVTLKARAVNGYTHQWRDARFQSFRLLCMASADSVGDMRDAHGMGWRTFRVKRAADMREAGEVTCPASAEAGKRTTCADCRACGGHSAKARASIVITAHGPTAMHFGG